MGDDPAPAGGKPPFPRDDPAPELGGRIVGASAGAGAPDAAVPGTAAGALDGTPISGGSEAGAGADAGDGIAAEAGSADGVEAAAEAGSDGDAGFGAAGIGCTGPETAGVSGLAPENHAIHARSLSRKTSNRLGCTSVSKRTRESINRARSAR